MSRIDTLQQRFFNKIERSRSYLSQAWILLPKHRREAYKREFETIKDQLSLLQDRIANEDFREEKV